MHSAARAEVAAKADGAGGAGERLDFRLASLKQTLGSSIRTPIRRRGDHWLRKLGAAFSQAPLLRRLACYPLALLRRRPAQLSAPDQGR